MYQVTEREGGTKTEMNGNREEKEVITDGLEVKKYTRGRSPTCSGRSPARPSSTSNCASSWPVLKMYRVRYLKASSWVGARRSSGRRPSGSLGGFPCFLWRVLFVLTEVSAHHPTTSGGWCCRRERGLLRRGTPPALSLCGVGSRPS